MRLRKEKIKSLVFTRFLLLLVPLAAISCRDPNFSFCDENIHLGNGLAIHPVSQKVYISKPTEKEDLNGKQQYSLFEVAFPPAYSEVNQLLAINSNYSDYHPIFSSKGDFMLFNSTRPHGVITNGKTDIYLANYQNGQFSKPQFLKNINTEHHDSYPTLTTTNRLYFNSDRPGGQGMMDIYVSDYKNGTWQKPVLVKELNSSHSENDLVVDPEERFIIFNRYFAETNEIDLFLSYRSKGQWSAPVPINVINTPGIWELTPTLSLNGQLLYLEINGKLQCHDLTTIITSMM